MKLITCCIFFKAPRLGRVKTRLARELGEERALELALAFYSDVLETTRKLNNIKVVVATDARDEWPAGVLDGIEVWEQGPGLLGERIERIFARAFRESTLAVAIGADCPELSVEDLRLNLEQLQRTDVVISPTQDGGYYLLGARQGVFLDLRKVRMGTAHAFADTVMRIEGAGFSWLSGPSGFDVDTPADLNSLIKRLRSGKAVAPRTRRLLLGSPDQVFD